MNRNYFFYILTMLSTIIFTCSIDSTDGGNNPSPSDSAQWLVPVSDVFDGGPGKDGIPSLQNPPMISAESATYLSDDDLVAGVLINGDAQAFPHVIMEHHEIANVEVGNSPVSVTFCPLTYSSIGWDRTLDGTETTFGVSGLLYKNNLVPYDRLTDSNWSQMLNKSINGTFITGEIETFKVVETTWGTWKQMYPETLVLSRNTGHNRNYGPPLYGDYDDNNNNILFPIRNDDPRIERKERLHGIIVNDQVKAFRFSSFTEGITTFNDTYRGQDLVITGSTVDNFIVSYRRDMPDGTVLRFEPVQDALPIIMIDIGGTSWDIFGNGVSGPREGEHLTKANSYIAFWFAWGDFYPAPEIFEL